MHNQTIQESGDIRRSNPDAAPEKPGIWRRLLQGLICLLIVAGGIAGSAYLKKTAPRAGKRPPRPVAPLVDVAAVQPGSHRVVVSAMGTVTPARELVLESRVTGEVIRMHREFLDGGILKAGEEVLRIDPKDYELAVTRKESAVVEAEYKLKLELGHQDVARREWEILNGDKPANPLDRELALRQPHLRKARSDLASAQAELKQARIDLDRTRITVPFNAIVRSRTVETGSQVAANEQLAELAGTDAYWIEVSIPVDRLRWISIPRRAAEAGSPARVKYQNGHVVTGQVIRLLSDLENEGRMARVLVSVQDPLGLKAAGTSASPLILGEYVRVEIRGREVDDVYRIPRSALRDNTRIWIAGKDGILSIRQVDTLWRDDESVLLREGLLPGEQLVVSDLAAAVEGMSVRVRQEARLSANAVENNNPSP